MKTQEKQFKAVAFQRKRREELSNLYNNNQEEFWKRMDEIRKKYSGKFRQKEKHRASQQSYMQ
jgi:hypothetical protein